jgi:hypothetical protein
MGVEEKENEVESKLGIFRKFPKITESYLGK